MQERRLVGAITLIALVAMACATVSGTPQPATSPSPVPSLGGGSGGGTGSGSPSGPATSLPSATTAAAASNGPPPSLGIPDPCSLISAADATTLIGTPVVHTQGGGAGTTGPCVYGDGNNNSVAVRVRLAADAAAAAKLVAAAQAGLAVTKAMTVTVLTDLDNDPAFIAKGHAGVVAYSIYVASGSEFFYISTLSETLAPSDDALKTAARTAIGNMRSYGH